MSTKNEKPKTLAEQMAQRKAESAQGKKEVPLMLRDQPPQTTSSKPTHTTTEKQSAPATEPVVEKRGETPEERATYARLMKGLNDLRASNMALELSKLDSVKEKMNKTAANVAELKSTLQPQEHDPRNVDVQRIMQQNITQRAAQKMVDEPTSVKGVEDKSKAAAKHLGFEPYILKPDVQSRKAMRDVFDSTDPLYESQGLAAAFKYIDTLPTNEEGKIVVDGVPYSRMELAQGLAPQIVSANSGSLFANNATYRDDMAKRMGYKNMDSYLAALDQRLAAMQRDLANQVSAQHAIQTPFNDMAGLEALATQERAGAKVLRDLRDQIKSMRAGEGGFEQFFKGLNEGFDAVNMATFGIADLASEYKQNIVYNKMLNGETLTPEERILADALNIKSDLDALREAQGQSWYNNIGAGVGYIGEIAPQFVFPMLAAKGLFKPINVGVKGAWEMTKKAAKKEGFKAAFKTGLGATMRVGDKSLNNIARFQINGMLTAPLQASTYSRFLEKRNAQYSIKDGKVTYTPTDAWRDLVDTWIEQGAEVGSELFGVSLEKFTSASLAAIGRNIGLGKVLRKIGGSVRNVETSKAMRFVKSGATKAGQQLFGYAGGVLPETLSEIYGDLTSEMFKSVLTGNGNFEEFKNPTYWATAFALSGIYGGAMSVLPSMVDYASYMRDISALGDIKKKILSDGKIEHTDLKNALIALSAGGSIKDATAHLAELDWKNGGYSLEEIGYAMDYIRAEAMQQVRMGEAAESQRLQRFGNVAQNIEAHAYRDEDGTPSGSMVMAVDKDGNSYHILEGDYSNKEATLKAINSEGKVVPLLASNIEGLSKASIADVTLFYYQQMFSTEFNLQRLESAEYAIERMDNPTMAQVADVAKRVGIVIPKEGDTITLVDGRTAKVTSISDDLGIMAEMTDGEGNTSMVPIPIMQILSSNTYIAEAQKLQNAEDALELAQAEEAQAEAEDAVEEGDATTEAATEEVSNGLVGTVVTLPNGNKGTIVEVDGDDVIVDIGRGVDAYEVYSKEELGMTEAAEMTTPQPTQTTAEQTTGEVTPEQATEALNEIAGIKPVPKLEDGSIDYDAIDDAETFAKHFEHDMGSREEAINSVQEMREQAMADLAEAEKKGKKARSANEKVANKVERQRLAERIAFYDNVLDIYTPKAEAPATPIESAPQVDTTPSQTEAQSPVEAAEGVQPSETTAEEQVDGYSKYNEKLERRVGLQHNELSGQLEENTRRMINDVATAFGVEVIFQREVRSSAGNLVNGKIDGSTVYFNWGKREHTLTWLMGHEFTHRMKALSPEAYNKLRDAVRAYLGEEKWSQLIEKQRKIYEERENPEEILSSAESAAIWKEAKEQTKQEDGSFDEEAAKRLYNKKATEARREAYIEEVVCDEVGVLARDHKAFDRFLRSEHVRNDGKFLRWLRKVWQSIKNAFSSDTRAFNEVMKTLDELINVSTTEVAKGDKPTKGGEKKSLSAPVFYSNAQYAVQNIKQEKATPEQWLKMIEKNGGLKAGEDKWLGLSDWLKASDKKTLTKDEVLQYIAENDIQIEEVSYGEPEYISENEIYESDAFSNLVASLTDYDEDDNPHINQEQYKELQNADSDFLDGFSLDYWGEGLDIDNKMAAARYLGLLGVDNEINNTRLQYTTQGLTKKKEIALVVPTIEPYNQSDEIHFGDAGEGRAVAWVRFGDAEAQRSEKVVRRVDEFEAPYKDVNGHEIYRPKDRLYAKDFISYGKLKSGEYAYVVYVNDKQIPVAHKSLEDARNALNEHYKANPEKRTRWDKVLVIDEIQSKRHQEGREKGYKTAEDEELKNAQGAEIWAMMQKYNVSRPSDLRGVVSTEDAARLDELSQHKFGEVPSAPFEKNWAELAMKRMLRYAAENGYDYVAWTTGDQQADRYDIGSVVKDIVAYDTKDADGNPIKKIKFRMHNMGTYNIATNVEGVIVKGDGEMKEGMRLSDITGKALAEKIMNGEGEDAMVFENGKDVEAKSLEGEELHIGNEGMKAFYDQMLPSFVKKYTKKWGAEVGEVTMPDLEENNTMHAVNVTDSMRESVMQGQPKYSLAYHGSGADFDKFDHSFMSSGEGQQIFGWGTYVSEVEDIAKTYAENSGKPNNIGYLMTGLKHRISAITQNIEYLNKRIEVYAKDAEYVDRLNAQKEELQKEISKAESEVSRLESLNVEQGKILYTVDIPDDTGDNYIEYDKPVSKGIRSKVNKALDEYNKVFVDDMRESLGVDDTMSDQEVLGFLRSNISMTSGKEMYADLSRELGGDKEASLFLADAGVAGISYPAEATTGGRADNARNYVIFNADEVKIIEKTRYSLSDTSAYQASAEVFVMLGGYKSKQITLNGLAKAVENIAKKYSKTGLLKIALEEYDNGDTKEFINALKGFVSVYPSTMLRDYSGDKATIEETFGGIWIDDTEEFAKFVSAVNKSPFEEDGEGIAYTDNYFYAYYRNVDGQPVPYASVYMNEYESQDVVNVILKKIKDEGDRDIRGWFDRIDEGVRNVESENDVISGTDKESSNTSANGKMGAKLSRKGRYFDNPSLYVKTSRTDGRGKVSYSLITPEMDASYLDAVERGDMATAQKMVMEAAKLAMPNTKVVDEDGNPKVVYHYSNKPKIRVFNPFRRAEELTGVEIEKLGKIRESFNEGKRPLIRPFMGIWATPIRGEYADYGKYEYALFADIRNPRETGRVSPNLSGNKNADGVFAYSDNVLYEVSTILPERFKSADPVTYDDAGNIIPLSERFNPEKGDIRYSLSEETAQIFDAAKAKFGTTYDMREAGYILPDGSMLDFSGRHQVRGGDTSFLNGDRTVDHREISDIAYDTDDNETGIKTDLGDFLDRGAIRIDSNAGAINLNVAPTKAQKDRLKRLIERNDGYVYVDFGKGWDTEHYAEYEAARASRVLGDIDRYFDEGIKPTGNVRYSLSNLPTGLLSDFAEEFEALQKEYESLDPTTIHAQHPYRIRKRKVVQKYVNYVSEVLGHNVENIVYDKTNNSHIKKLYDKLKPYLKGTKEEDYSVFVESLRNRENQANYIVGTNIITHEISDETAFMNAANTLRAYIHENVHRIIEKLGVDEKTLEDILAEGLSLKANITQSYIADYLNDSKHEQGEETLAYAIGDRISYSEDREKLLNAIEGNIAAKELFESQKISVPLRDSYIEKIINELHNEYKSRREGEDSTGADSANRGEINKVDNQGLWRGYSEAGPSEDIGIRGRVLTPTRYSLQSGDMPFFNDNGDVITFDNTDITGEDYDAVELRSPMPTMPRTTEEVIKAHLSARHNAAKERIRRESRVLRDAVRKQYREEQVRRREGVESMRTNAAKVDYIIGAPIETLDYEAQVLAMIAMGTLSISWESLSKELGVKSGDKKSYRHITNGATATLDAVVHAWWESINGYENGIDTQDLRNALIDVLMQVPTAKGALSILEDRFDHALRNRDEALEDIDREEDRLIAEEDARYNEQMTTLSDPARMSEYVRQYEHTVGFHEELTAIEGTLRKMDSELKAVRKRAERAQMRSKASKQKQFDKSKEIIGKQREFYKDKLAEQRASFKEVREAITESKRALIEALSTYEQLGFNKQEVRSLVDAVNKARSMADINKVRVKIENVILNVSIREKRRHMDQMLNLRLPSGELVETWVSKQIHDGKMSVADGKRILADMFRGTNANGVRVAKYVDDETARVMDYLRKNLIVPNHGAHYEEKKDADGNVIGHEYVPSREEEMGADVLLKSNNELCNELLGKAVEGTITEEEKIKLQARQLYEPYLFVANARTYVKGVRAEGEKLYEEIQRKKAELGDAYTKEERDADYAALEANALHLVEAKTAYDDALTEYNETLSNVIMSGRDKLREFREAKEAHKTNVVNMAIRAIGGEARTIASQPTVAERIAAKNRTSVHSTYWTFDSACREIDRFSPNGEGEFYKHFMGGMTKASNDFFTRTDNHIQDICDAVRRITGSKRDPRRALRAFMRKADMTTVGSITYKNDKGKMEPLPLRISNALFTLAMWGQAQYREIMEKRGITKEQMEALKAKIESIDGRYIDFMEWVIDSFLPSTRLEYNEVHKQLFGASMDNIEDYFPAKVVEGYRDEDIAKVDSGLPSTMTGSIITRQKHNNMPQFDQSFFSVLLNHIQNMDQWASFSPLVEDLNAVISNPEFKRLVNTHMAGVNNDRTGKGSLWQIFKDTSAVAIGSYSCKTPDADSMISKFTGAWAASNISWRISTALKQLSGITAVAVSGFGKTQGMFLKNMMLSPLAVKWAMENSPMLQKRFGDRFAGNEVLMRKYGQDQAKGLDLRKGKLKDGLERVNDFIRFLTVDVGMTPNAAVDALVVAITMKTVYDVELSNLTKGKPETATEEQKSYAMMKAEIFANETQQSAEGAYLSVPQAQRSVMTAVMTTYLNASFASHRLRVQGVQDIYRWMSPKYRKEIDDRYGKGAARKAAGKGLARLLSGISIDATFILMSRAVGQGLWRLIIDWFDDTEDNDDEADPIDWSDIGWEIGFQTAFGGMLGGNIITSLRNGFMPAGMPALEELEKSVYDLLGWTEKKIKKGDWSIDLNFWALGEIIFKYGYGLDPETMLNIARGIEGICRDKDPMAAMKILNTPQSMVNIIAGPRRDNETVKEYVERRARLEVLFAQPKYSELFDDEGTFIGKRKYAVVGGAKDYRLKGLFKEYNKHQRATVMSKYLSPSEVAEFERIDSEYKAIVESLGWEVGKNPVDDMVDKTTKKYKYPNGLTNVHYAALKEIATAAERTRRAQDRWAGTDMGFADLIRTEYSLRSEVIKGSKSRRAAVTAKEKIDRAEKQRKKNQKK